MTDEIKIFLSKHRIMSLATFNDDQPWLCTVYYAEDDHANIYFVTGRKTRHAEEIGKNDKVAYAIFDSSQVVTQDKEGFQATGTCAMVTDSGEIETALRLWHAKNPGVESHINAAYVSGDEAKSAVFKITPDYMKHYNDVLYGDKDFYEWKR